MDLLIEKPGAVTVRASLAQPRKLGEELAGYLRLRIASEVSPQAYDSGLQVR
jgi:hypothetical protein